jgi:hypothetical protein
MKIACNGTPFQCEFDKKNLILRAKVNHFTHFGEYANPLESGPGRIMASNVDLHSGAATYSYPLELPPGPGGFQPSLTLSYNSGSVDEMKNKRDVGSWVGIGWSMSIGSIAYDSTNRKYYLNISGISTPLINTSINEYHTNPEQYYKITRFTNHWEVLDRSGTLYRFGGTDNTTQYLLEDWCIVGIVTLYVDTNGNEL